MIQKVVKSRILKEQRIAQTLQLPKKMLKRNSQLENLAAFIKVRAGNQEAFAVISPKKQYNDPDVVEGRNRELN